MLARERIREAARGAHMSAHTPAPWHVVEPLGPGEPLWISAATVLGIAKIEPCERGDGLGERLTDEDHANARLIAAAPDLLAALRLCAQQFRVHEAENREKGASEKASASGGLAQWAEAAIARADGPVDPIASLVPDSDTPIPRP